MSIDICNINSILKHKKDMSKKIYEIHKIKNR